MSDKKVFFFCMVVCSHRTGEHIGKRCGVVLANTKEDAKRIAWEKYGSDTACQLWVEEVQRAILRGDDSEYSQFSLWGFYISKLFKDGRVDIKFRNAAEVQEFVENYLRKQIGGTNCA